MVPILPKAAALMLSKALVPTLPKLLAAVAAAAGMLAPVTVVLEAGAVGAAAVVLALGAGMAMLLAASRSAASAIAAVKLWSFGAVLLLTVSGAPGILGVIVVRLVLVILVLACL